MKEVSIHEKASIHDFFFPKGAEIETSTLKTTQLDGVRLHSTPPS